MENEEIRLNRETEDCPVLSCENTIKLTEITNMTPKNVSEEDKISVSSEIVGDDKKTTASNSDFNNNQKSEGNFFLSTLHTCNDGYIIGASIRGRSHEIHETPCQDYHSYEYLSGWHILSVSDGAGSAKFAARGAKANSTFSIRLVKQMLSEKKWIENEYFPSELEWYIEARAIFEKIKLIIRAKVSELDEDCVETDFNATLMLAIITPKGILSAHIGDGRMGYLSSSDEWRSIITPHKGNEANQTLFLQSAWTTPSVPAFNINGVFVPETAVIAEFPQALVLMSDGCERASWECYIRDDEIGKYVDKNLPHRGFMSPLIDALNDCSDDNDKQNLFGEILDHGTVACERELDDKTMLLAVFR